MTPNPAFEELLEATLSEPTPRLGDEEEAQHLEEREDLGFTGLSNPFWNE